MKKKLSWCGARADCSTRGGVLDAALTRPLCGARGALWVFGARWIDMCSPSVKRGCDKASECPPRTREPPTKANTSMQRTTTATAKKHPHGSAAKRGAGRWGVGASKELWKWASLVGRRHSRRAHANTDAASVPRLARLRACASSRPAAQPLAGRGGSGTARYNGAERRRRKPCQAAAT